MGVAVWLGPELRQAAGAAEMMLAAAMLGMMRRRGRIDRHAADRVLHRGSMTVMVMRRMVVVAVSHILLPLLRPSEMGIPADGRSMARDQNRVSDAHNQLDIMLYKFKLTSIGVYIWSMMFAM
jgi:hypothetical protein